MAVVLSRASSAWLTASTWETVDATSYVNSESATGVVTTSYLASAGATTGVITATGIGLKLSVRTGTTGTLSAHLAIAAVEVPGTLVTINTADLPVAATADLNGGWFFLKFAAGVVLAGATSYTVEVKTSSASQISLFSTATTAWSHFISTNASAAPVAGDDVIIAGEYLSAGSSNAFTVTIDETASTDYGAASTSLVTPAISVCNKGILKSGTTATTVYVLKVSGTIVVYSGGELDFGTVATPLPRDGSFTLTLDSASNVDFGITVRNLGTLIAQGLSRTAAKLIYSCKLNTDEAIASTSLGVDTDTGWLDNDEIAVASTTRTAADCEAGAMNGAAGAATLTVDGFAGAGGGLAVAHSGTSPTQAEVILLTRNVRIFGASATLQGYIDIKATATVDCDWTEFKWLGSATANKRGIDTACTTGVQSFQYCALHNFEVASSRGLNMTGASGTGLTFSNNVTFKIANEHYVNVANSGSSVLDTNIFMLNTTASTNLIILADIGGTFTNITLVGSVFNALSSTEGFNAYGTYDNIKVHSSGGIGIILTNQPQGTLNNITVWRNSGAGFSIQSGDFLINTITLFGNATNNITLTGGSFMVLVVNPVSNGDSTFSTTNGLNMANVIGGGDFKILNGNFGTVSGINTAHTNDLAWGNATANPYGHIFLTNTILASATELNAQTNLSPNSFISSQKHDQTAGLHKTWKKYGTLIIDTGTVHSPGTESLAMQPNNASNKLESSGAFGGFKVQVANGQTCTPTIFVYEDAGYNGARARLIVKRNDAMGITADTVLDTATAASDAAWEGLTGTTAAVTDNGTLEFVIDADGTAGNLFVASASAVVA